MRAATACPSSRSLERSHWFALGIGLLLLTATLGAWAVMHQRETRLLAYIQKLTERSGNATAHPEPPANGQSFHTEYLLLDETVLALGLLLTVCMPLLLNRLQRLRRAEANLRAANEGRADADAQLAESEERFRAIFNQASVGIVLTTIEGQLLLANPRFNDITGYSLDELRAMTLSELIHPEDQTAGRVQFQQLLAGEMDSISMTLRFGCRDQGIVWVNLAVSLIRDGQGAPLHAIGIVEDITTRRQAEEAIWQVHAELERRVEERTGELAEANAALTAVNDQLRAEITEREHAQQALAQSEARMRLGLEGTNVGMWDCLLPNSEISFVRHWAEILGYAPEQIEPGMAMWERCIHPDDRPRVEEAARRHLAGLTPYCENEQRLRDPNGEWRWLFERSRVVAWDDQGRPFRMIGAYMDITERIQAQEALRQAHDELEQHVRERTAELAETNTTLRAEIDERERIEETLYGANASLAATNARLAESEERYRALAETIPQMVWTAQPNGKRDFYNQYWCEYTGISREEGIKGGWIAAIHADDVEQALGSWRSALELGHGYSLEVRLRRFDGQYRWHQSRVVPVRDEQNAVTKWIGTAMDIHDRIQAAEALQEADRRKDEFLAMLAHELRNPLAPIGYAVHMLSQAGLTEQTLTRQREVIGRQVKLMGRLLDDLLDVSRITRGKIQLKKQRLDLRLVADHCVEACRPAFQARGHELFYVRYPAPLWLEGDPERLGQVISNLLNNANKYTEAGGKIWLSVTAEPLPPDAGDQPERSAAETPPAMCAFVRVRDTGIGITPEMLTRVFELFAQADHSLDRAQGGLGIGLTLVRRLVEMHGGQVHAHSAGLGQGSEFAIRLPLKTDRLPLQTDVAAPAIPPGEPMAGSEADGPADSPGGELKILVVDDNADIAGSMAELLELWGYRPILAYDGAQALALAGRIQPDVVVLDLGLPDLSGHEVARRIRQMPELEGVALIALTGYGGPEDQRQAQLSGFNHYFTKPVELAALHQTLERLARPVGD